MTFPLRPFRAQCHDLAEDLLRSGQASADALALIKPGGADNPRRGTAAWVRYYGQLQLLRGRSQGGALASIASPEVRMADALTLAALAEQPRPVGSVPGLAVHPKSFAALLHCHAREILVGHLTRVVASANVHRPPDEIVFALHDAIAELSYQTRLLAWIATSDGPALPFSEIERTPELPPAIAELSPIAVLEINRLFAAVNWSGLKAMEALITPPESDDGSPSKRLAWSPFFGTLAMELHENPVDLLRRRSLASVLASTQLAASTRREAMAEAKRTAQTDRHEAS